MEESIQSKKVTSRTTSTLQIVARSQFWLRLVDFYAAAVAASLPWSTSAVSIFTIVWFAVLLPTIDHRKFLNSIRRPESLAPLTLFALAMLGVLWVDAPWSVALQGLSPVLKLLIIPFLLYHFARSSRAKWVLIAFLTSCAVLLAYSFIIYIVPGWRLTTAHGFYTEGVPVRNVIDQNQEFALCLFICASLALTAFRQHHFAFAVGLGGLSAAFLSNIVFVAFARTSIVYIIPLAVMFVFCHFQNRTRVSLLIGLVLLLAATWFGSGYLRERIQNIAVEYKQYQETNRPTSTGQRLEYWATSIRAIADAPLFGHGTGATKQLFDKEAQGKKGAWADSVRNPHNQTLSVAVQWGVLGCAILYAMWYYHFMLFWKATFPAWVGLCIVFQNFLSSLLNSHLFDFQEGWMYVLGVGVAGGLCQRLHDQANSHGERI